MYILPILFLRTKPQVNRTQVEESGVAPADKEFDDCRLSFLVRTDSQQTLSIDRYCGH